MDLSVFPDPVPPVTGWHADPAGEAAERYWAAEWSDQTRNTAEESHPRTAATAHMQAVDDRPIPDDQRKAILAARIAHYIGKGYRPESQSEFQAVVVEGHRPNHLLHLVLSLLTLGLWAIFVWLPIAIFGGESRKVITVDPYGRALESKG